VLVSGTVWTEDSSDLANTLDGVFKVQTSDAEQSSILFSSFLGAVPPQNTPVLAHTLETLGAAGNIGSGLVTKIASSISGGATLAVTNITIATGGRDRETVEEARIKAPRDLRRLSRVVSLPDYQDALNSLANVATSQAINHNGYVECYVAPAGAARFFVGAPVIAVTAVTGGTFAAGTYKVGVTARDIYGETATFEYTPSTRAVLDRTVDVTAALDDQLTVVVTNPSGATGFTVYLSDDDGATWRVAATNVAADGSGTTTIPVTAFPGTAAVALPTANTTGVRAEDGVQSLKQAAETYLNTYRALCTVFSLFNPTYVTVDVTATVKIYDNYSQVDRSGAVQSALTAYFAPGQRAFAEDINLSDLYALIKGIDGVRSVNFTTPTDDIVINDGEVAALGTVTLAMVGGVAG
jgi:uncharacterized phage protein gp47/JayE